MKRIITATKPSAVTITVGGGLSREAVEAIDISVSRAIGSGRAVQLFLRGGTEIDENGRAFLGSLAMRVFS